ncbi:MAG: methyltransferase domain-containing protein [Planctomycetales bacterium]|nr:methyltransferase domain-containing protein [Planctomycetales bacterium]
MVVKNICAESFPRASNYNPEWVMAGLSGGANPLWLTEWLCRVLPLQPGMRVLDLGCGRALSSIFLHREFGVQVWATDLWFSVSENLQRVRDAGLENSVFPISADARSLPFCKEFFDAIVSIDSFMYFGTDDYYLNYLARYLKPKGFLGIAQAGFLHEIAEEIPEHLSDWWREERPYSLHSVEWWSRHWGVTGILDIKAADSLDSGWTYWRDWLQFVAPENKTEIEALERDAGQTFGYQRIVGQLRDDAPLFDPPQSIPSQYSKHPVVRAVG